MRCAFGACQPAASLLGAACWEPARGPAGSLLRGCWRAAGSLLEAALPKVCPRPALRARSLVGACCELLSLQGCQERQLPKVCPRPALRAGSDNYRRFAQGRRCALGACWEFAGSLQGPCWEPAARLLAGCSEPPVPAKGLPKACAARSELVGACWGPAYAGSLQGYCTAVC